MAGRRSVVGVLSVVFLLAHGSAAQCGIYFVDQGAPKASDQNPGTEILPWSTLGKAAAAAVTGDVVWVKAGTYRGPLELKSDGVTIQAHGDSRVILEPANDVMVIAPATWRKLPDRKNVYTCDARITGVPDQAIGNPSAQVTGNPSNWLVRVGGQALAFEVTQGVRTDLVSADGRFESVVLDVVLADDSGRRWTVDKPGSLYINLDGEDPAHLRVELIKLGPGGVAVKGRDCHVKGLELRYCSLDVSGEGNIVEDCVVYAGAGGIGGKNVLRRCAFKRCDTVGLGTDAVLEESLFVGSLRWNPEVTPPQVPHAGGYYAWRQAIGSNNQHNKLVRYNVIADSALWGYWTDCMAYGSYMYGNTFWRNRTGAAYLEGSPDVRVLYNAMVENGGWGHGLMLSLAPRCMVAYNLIEGNTNFGFGSALTRWWAYPLATAFHHNLVRGNPNALMFEGENPLTEHELAQVMTNTFDHNIYSLPSGGTFAKPGIATLADWQKLTKMDMNSRMDDGATMENFGLGTFTFRVPGSDDPDIPVPMVANVFSTGEHQDPVFGNGGDVVLSWNMGEGDALPSLSWRLIYNASWQSSRTAGYSTATRPAAGSSEAKDPRFWLQVENPGAGPAGSGFWSRTLPTVPGARIKLSCRVQGGIIGGGTGNAFGGTGPGVELKPVVPGRSVVAFIRFSTPTDQGVTQQYMIGGPGAEEVLPRGGSFPWKTISGEFVAPPGAERFNVFLGMLPGEGTVRFAETHIDTLPGARPTERAMPQGVEYVSMDLSSFFNRNLDKNLSGRLKEGEGYPEAPEGKGLARGRQLKNGVPFQIDRGIALRGNMFKQDPTLTRAVRGIPIRRHVEGLYLLHVNSVPWPDRPQFSIIVHRADGSTESFPYYGGWEPSVGQRSKVSNVRWLPGMVLEWVNTREGVQVESVDFVGADTGEPVLLAITAAVKK